MARRPNQYGLSPHDIGAGMTALKSANAFLIRVCNAYPIDFDPNVPYGAASSAIKALAQVGSVMTGDSELFRAQKLKSSKPRDP